ncbi:universal stress protein [Ilyobacter sp.]|uniref:universal stress protein n=1 Tax=Ilyobacter sp. TaxID=3100343 RepID=UPI0035678F2B
MLNRVLVAFIEEKDVEYLTRYAKVIKEHYPGAEIVGMFIHSVVDKDEFKEFMAADDLYRLKIKNIDHEYQRITKVEKEHSERIEKSFLSVMKDSKFYNMVGDSSKILLEELKFFDLAILAKSDELNHEEKTLLNTHHKPVILVPKFENYSFEKILLADDQKIGANKSLFNFMEIFSDTKDFTAVTVNGDKKLDTEELKTYMEKAGKNIKTEFLEGEVHEMILEYSKDYDLIVMGNLKHSIMLEKAIRDPGIKIIESSEKPIFIA